eukprot:SAG31_NODE_5417_length_2549_cov_2.290612_3_plen_140_part_00
MSYLRQPACNRLSFCLFQNRRRCSQNACPATKHGWVSRKLCTVNCANGKVHQLTVPCPSAQFLRGRKLAREARKFAVDRLIDIAAAKFCRGLESFARDHSRLVFSSTCQVRKPHRSLANLLARKELDLVCVEVVEDDAA